MPKLLNQRKNKKTVKLSRESKSVGNYSTRKNNQKLFNTLITIKTPNGKLRIHKLPIKNPDSILVTGFKVYKSVDYNETKRQSIKNFVKVEPTITKFGKVIQEINCTQKTIHSVPKDREIVTKIPGTIPRLYWNHDNTQQKSSS